MTDPAREEMFQILRRRMLECGYSEDHAQEVPSVAMTAVDGAMTALEAVCETLATEGRDMAALVLALQLLSEQASAHAAALLEQAAKAGATRHTVKLFNPTIN